MKLALFHKFSIKLGNWDLDLCYKSTGVNNGEAWKFVPGKTDARVLDIEHST